MVALNRTEENALGYHDDVGIAKEDLEEGIDLMDTDNEDAEEEEEDSEEERRVAEGFIEDAQFAAELGLDPQEMQEYFQRQREEMDEKENERILDVIRGDARRRKAAGQEDAWVPNRAARQRGMVLGQVPAGFSSAMLEQQGEDLDEGLEGDAAVSAARAAERMERLKWIQEQRLLEVEKAQKELEEQEALAEARAEGVNVSRPGAPIRRFNSRSAPALAAFSRQLSTMAQTSAPKPGATVEAGVGETAGAEGAAAGSSARRWRKIGAAVSILRCNFDLCASFFPAVWRMWFDASWTLCWIFEQRPTEQSGASPLPSHDMSRQAEQVDAWRRFFDRHRWAAGGERCRKGEGDGGKDRVHEELLL
jgi:hypothetical protein